MVSLNFPHEVQNLPPAVRKALHALFECTDYLGDDQSTTLWRAFSFAHKAHLNQKRNSGVPYIVHPIAVVELLARLKLDVDALVAGLLHDTIEDNSEITREMVAQEFGETVAFLVDSVTKLEEYDKRIKKNGASIKLDKRERQGANRQNLILSSAKDLRALVIKLADRLHNMRTLESLAQEKQQRIAQETLDVYAPLASLIGIQVWKNEMENLALRAVNPDAYYKIQEHIAALYQGDHQEKIERFCKELDTLLGRHKIPVREVYGRLKTPYAIWRKSQEKSLKFSETLDIIGLRIIVKNRRACYTALGVLHHQYEHIPNSFDDYISAPKPNGYRSLHTVIHNQSGEKKIEVQIRSKVMDDIARTGLASHWGYKNNPSLSSEARDLIARLEEDSRDGEISPLMMGELNLDSLVKEIIAFTPKGNLVRLPLGASVLDFAFHVHSEIGLHYKEALVNGKNVAMGHEVTSGDIVRIVTDPNCRPEAFWKQWIITQRARSAIRHALTAEELQHFKEFTADIAVELSVVLTTRITTETMRRTFHHFAVENLGALESKLAQAQIAPEEILHILQPSLVLHSKRQKKDTYGLETQDFDNSILRCHYCHPLPGDQVYGCIVLNKGTVVHRKECHALLSYLKKSDAIESRRLARAGFDENQKYPTSLDCTMTHRPGMLGLIAAAIGERGVNITDISFLDRNDQHYLLRFGILVQHKEQIDGIEKTVRKLASDAIEIRRPILPPPLEILETNDED